MRMSDWIIGSFRWCFDDREIHDLSLILDTKASSKFVKRCHQLIQFNPLSKGQKKSSIWRSAGMYREDGTSHIKMPSKRKEIQYWEEENRLMAERDREMLKREKGGGKR